ncbi:MAG: hypothetical protein K2Q20_14965 [Phycisphaerales bacterium]|nr:hypothetical protein [Phycisphaerales bacterium]
MNTTTTQAAGATATTELLANQLRNAVDRLTAELGEIGIDATYTARGPRRRLVTGELSHRSEFDFGFNAFDFDADAMVGERMVCVSAPTIEQAESDFRAAWRKYVTRRDRSVQNVVRKLELMSGKRCVLVDVSVGQAKPHAERGGAQSGPQATASADPTDDNADGEYPSELEGSMPRGGR